MKSVFRKIYFFVRGLSVLVIGLDFQVFKVNRSRRFYEGVNLISPRFSSLKLPFSIGSRIENDYKLLLAKAKQQYLSGNVDCFANFNRYHIARKQWLERSGLKNLDMEFLDVGVVSGAFGNLYSLETLLQAKTIGLSDGPQKTALIIGNTFKPRNKTLYHYFKNYLAIVSDPYAAKKLDSLADDLRVPIGMCVPMGRSCEYLDIAANLVYGEYLKKNQNPTFLSLEKDHKVLGRKAIQSFGLENYSWHVTVHVRQPGFRDNSNASEDWRNADLLSYVKAIELITRQGGHVFIMGDPSMRVFPKMKNVVDYAHHTLRSDFLDVYLAASSKFCIATASGFMRVPRYFGVPVIFTNCTFALPFYSLRKDDLYLPRLLKHKSGGLLTFKEFFDPKVALLTTEVLKRLDQQGIIWIENDENDICLTVEAMIEKLFSKGRDRKKNNNQLEKKFRRIAEDAARVYSQRRVTAFSTPAEKYLKKYEELLS